MEEAAGPVIQSQSSNSSQVTSFVASGTGPDGLEPRSQSHPLYKGERHLPDTISMRILTCLAHASSLKKSATDNEDAMMASLRLEESKSSFSLMPKTLPLDSCNMPTNNNSLETEPVPLEDSGLQRCKVSLLYEWEYIF